MDFDIAAAQEAYRRDGVVFLPGALDAYAMDEALKAYQWSLANPGPLASRIPQHGEGVFYQDLYNPGCMEAYRHMLETSCVGDVVAQVWGAPDV